MAIWRIIDTELELSEPLGFGIVNVTDDSFYSGARSATPERAVADGLDLLADGFDGLDLGAVAARSGPPVPPAEEAARLIPAIEGVAAATEAPLAADTFSPEVARSALEAGASIVNDIGGGCEEMLDLAAGTGCGLVLMHIEGPPRIDREPPRYDDAVDHLKRWFAERIERAAERGVDPTQIAIDPGLDFDLTVADDLEVLRRLAELEALGRPIYISLSRKDFLGATLAGSWEARLSPERCEAASCAATALATTAGARIHRLHDRSALDAMRVAWKIVEARRG